MIRIIPQIKESTVNFRMQRFDPSIHNFRGPGEFGDFNGGNSLFFQETGGAPGRDDFDPHI